MALQTGKMYRPTDIIRSGNDLFVVEQRNHRVSKWIYSSSVYSSFRLDAGRSTSLQIDNVGSGYVSPTLVFSEPDLPIANPVQTTGTISQVGGQLDNPIITLSGNGYSTAPTVTVVDSTGIDGAVSVNGFVEPWGSNGDGTTGIPGRPDPTTSTDDRFYRPTGIGLFGNRLYVT
ncbi:unnamed protein product, partial [marine sediment metagenome]